MHVYLYNQRRRVLNVRELKYTALALHDIKINSIIMWLDYRRFLCGMALSCAVLTYRKRKGPGPDKLVVLRTANMQVTGVNI